ncbi:MAG: hypothetical protein ACI9TH_001616 [Kiritimatiellia bacterium]|jgi:hypothetical protein
MKFHTLLLLTLLGGSPLLAAPDWSALIAAQDPGSRDLAWAKSDHDQEAWAKMELPIHFEKAGLPEYDGVVWFRKRFNLPEAWDGVLATLSLGPIDDMDVTWVNGTRVGGMEHPGAHFTPRVYRVPAGILKAGGNVIAIRVMDHGWGGGIAGMASDLYLQSDRLKLPLAGTWRYKAGANLETLIQGPTPNRTSIEGFTDGFTLEDGDVIAFAGGTETVKQIEAGYLETVWTQTGQKLHFRDIAWQADTVYQQQRPRNFGTQLEQLHRIEATVIVCAFGQIEALDGMEELPDFIAAYEALLDTYAQRTGKIVLLTPKPFERRKDRPALPDLTTHNKSVTAYAQAIASLAARLGYPCVDLSNFSTGGQTTDGIHLSLSGHWQLARELSVQLLKINPPSGTAVNPTGSFDDPTREELRQQILRKNQLWRQHWRPTNWAFVYGNRSHVPSSHDHRPGQPRWFPLELQRILPMIDDAEQEIFTTVEKR